MSRFRPPYRARIGLTVAIIALLPGVLALLAVGVGTDPLSSSLCLSQAAGACSVAALQGLDRRASIAPLVPVPPVASPSPEPSLCEATDETPDEALRDVGTTTLTPLRV